MCSIGVLHCVCCIVRAVVTGLHPSSAAALMCASHTDDFQTSTRFACALLLRVETCAEPLMIQGGCTDVMQCIQLGQITYTVTAWHVLVVVQCFILQVVTCTAFMEFSELDQLVTALLAHSTSAFCIC
jgi:hypothetical protein